MSEVSHVGRFAPTTSGPAHVGTLLSALLAWLDVRSLGGRFVLRLDDLDTGRHREEFAKQIPEALRSLGLDWDDVVRQSERHARYLHAARRLDALGLLYPCSCTRAQLQSERYSGICRENRRAFEPDAAVRWRVRLGHDSVLGDLVVWRTEGHASYHLATVVDEADFGVTRVVRGRDLEAASCSQQFLMKALGYPVPEFIHHLLLCESQGEKLSKSRRSVLASEIGPRLCGELAALCGWWTNPERYSLRIWSNPSIGLAWLRRTSSFETSAGRRYTSRVHFPYARDAMPSLLIVDDSATIRETVKAVLAGTNMFDKVITADSAEHALDLVTHKEFDLVLCDVVMPGKSGFDLLRELRADPRYFDVPVIMLSGQDSVDSKIEGLSQGASDYLTKPFDHGELIARLKVHLKIKELQDQLKEANERFKHLSVTDELTGLFNRRYLMDTLEKELARAHRHEHPLSIAMIDVDHFKKINDSFGHPVGDAVLAQMGDLLRSTLRSHDTAARYGGEEFCILLPMEAQDGAASLAERIRQKAHESAFANLLVGDVTLSVGVTSFPAHAEKDPEELLALADRALYAAKEAGRNRVVRSWDEA